MILLDTNVVSEVMRPTPEPSVIGWLNRRDAATLYVSTITLAEIAYGLNVLPAGKKRRRLEDRFGRFVEAGFQQRILGFDVPAAHRYGELMGVRKKAGRPMAILDGQIAAIAKARDFAVATRNVKDFEGCGIHLVNPFAET